jgi:hypothetical protein
MRLSAAYYLQHNMSVGSCLDEVFMRIRLVPISCRSDECLRQDDVGFADLLASGTCMEASWIPILIGLHAGSVMGVK